MNFVFFDSVFIKISLPLSFQFLSTSRVFQIVLVDGGISHWMGRGRGNGKFYSGGGEEFFIWWWEPEGEWFWPFEPFSLKLISTFYTFYKQWMNKWFIDIYDFNALCFHWKNSLLVFQFSLLLVCNKYRFKMDVSDPSTY